MGNVRPDATTDEIREIQSEMTRNRDIGVAAELGAALADLVEELDGRLTGGEPLPTAWQQN